MRQRGVRRAILIGVGCAAAAAAAGITVLAMRGGQTAPADTERGVHLECDRCGHLFVLLPEGRNLSIADVEPGVYRADCPACGAQGTCIQTVRCPNESCGKWFIPASHRLPMAQRGARQVHDICPYCRTDRNEWFRQYYRRP